jgi:hypothetical protein
MIGWFVNSKFERMRKEASNMQGEMRSAYKIIIRKSEIRGRPLGRQVYINTLWNGVHLEKLIVT